MSLKQSYDYIIVGAGSAGCVMANRLSANPDCSVLVVEAGAMDNSWQLKMPSAFAYALNSSRFDWGYVGEPEPFIENRQLDCPRGKVVGGSSSINAMCFVRGNPLDYDRWASESGYHHWSYENCLPFFQKMESFSEGADSRRGGDGPLKVLKPNYSNSLNSVFAKACVEAGYDWNEDSNGDTPDGFGRMDQNIYKGERHSAATAYLHPVLHRPNLTLICRAHTNKVLFDKQSATGIELDYQNRILQIKANKEVVLCAGAINSPKLLLLSGIGSEQSLKELDITLIYDSPNVGENLQDHVNVNVSYECLKPITATPCLQHHRKALLGLQWWLFRTGMGATNHFEIAGYIKSSHSIPYPDLQLLFFPLLVDDSGTAPKQAHGFQVAISQLRSNSKGRIKLRSAAVKDSPSILFNYLEDETDLSELKSGIRQTRKIFSTPAFNAYLGKELSPGLKNLEDAELDIFIRKNLRSTKHPCGTCQMGNHTDAVVDDIGRVHGIDNLRVIDASIMPSIPSGNLNAPTIMLAEKIADSFSI